MWAHHLGVRIGGMTYGVTAIGAGKIASCCFYYKYKKVGRICWRCGTPVQLRKQPNINCDL